MSGRARSKEATVSWHSAWLSKLHCQGALGTQFPLGTPQAVPEKKKDWARAGNREMMYRGLPNPAIPRPRHEHDPRAPPPPPHCGMAVFLDSLGGEIGAMCGSRKSWTKADVGLQLRKVGVGNRMRSPRLLARGCRLLDPCVP